jgi:hypothetical protein
MTEPTPRTEAREATRARLLAERILDRWHGDPDDDLAILARAVVRLNELAQARTEALDEFRDHQHQSSSGTHLFDES